MVNLKALERSLAKIEEVGRDELAFEANGVSVVLRALLPEEEEITDAYARLAYTRPLSDFDLPEEESEEGSEEEDPITITRHRIWLDRLRQATLGFVIIELDGQDLRNLRYLDTGETDQNGNPVSVLKHEALRELVARWSRPVLTQMFGAYSELMDRVNLRASRLVQFKPADIEVELKRLRMRTEELERHKKMSIDPSLRHKDEQTDQDLAKSINTGSLDQMGALADMSTREQEAPASRVPLTQQLPPQQPAPQVPAPQAPVQEPFQAYSDRRVPEPFEGDSRIDMSDPDEALAAENARQEILYRQQLERKRQAEQDPQPRRPLIQTEAVRPIQPPRNAVNLQNEQLREARNTADHVQGFGTPPQTTPVAQGTRRVGGKDVPLYKQPTVTLERRGPAPDYSQVQIDPPPSAQNPRFVGPKKDG